MTIQKCRPAPCPLCLRAVKVGAMATRLLRAIFLHFVRELCGKLCPTPVPTTSYGYLVFRCWFGHLRPAQARHVPEN